MNGIGRRVRVSITAARVSLGTVGGALSLVRQAASISILGYATVTLVAGMTPLAAAWLVKGVLDVVGRPEAPIGLSLRLALALAATSVVAATLPQAGRYLQARLRRRVSILAQDRLFRAVERQQGLRSFEDPQFLDRLRLAQQAAESPTAVAEHSVGLVTSVAPAIGFVASLAALNPWMAGVLVAAAAPALAAQSWLSRRQMAVYWEISPRQRRELFYRGLLTSVQAAQEIRLFGAGRFLRARMRVEREASDAAEERLDRRTLSVHGALAVLAAAISGGGMVWAVLAATDGSLSLGDVTMFIAAVAGVQAGLGRSIGEMAGMQHALLVFGNYLSIERADPDLPEAANPVPPLRRGIELRDVWFRYGTAHPWILRGVNLFIPYGRATALVGRNGAGKTTLVKLLCRLYDPTHGAVLWDGVDLRCMPVTDLRRNIGAVFQDHMNYELTAAENIAIGAVGAPTSRDRLEAAARRAGIHDTLKALPLGYDTLLSRVFQPDGADPDTGVVLSGGQWQRLALARALLRWHADLLILDEPSSGLDAVAEYEVHRRLREDRAGRTCLLISHRLSAIRDADQIVVLADGAVIETGSHQDLIAGAGVYARLFGMQAKGYRDKPGSEPTSPEAATR